MCGGHTKHWVYEAIGIWNNKHIGKLRLATDEGICFKTLVATS